MMPNALLAFVLTAAATAGYLPAMAPADTVAIRQAAEQVTRGMGLAEDRRFAEAAAAYDDAARRVPAFAPWAHLMAARALAGTGDTAAVRQRLESAEDAEMVREWGWPLIAEARLAVGDTAGAVAHLQAARDRIEGADRRAQATHRLAGLARITGDPAAPRLYRQVIDAAPGSAAGLAAARALTDTLTLGADDRLAVARVYLRHGELNRGLPLLEREIAARPAEEAALRLEGGRALWSARRYDDAERWLAPGSGAARAADEVRAERVLFQARSQFRDGRRDVALATFRRVIAEHPNTPAAGRAHFLLADLAHDDGDRARAMRHYEAAHAAGGEDAALSAMRLVTLHWTAGARDRALAVLRAAGEPDVATFEGQQRAFWMARAGDPEANRLLESVWQAAPFTYYGIRAAEALGHDRELASRIRPASVTPGPDERRRAGELADRIAVLTRAGLSARANWDVGRAMEGGHPPLLLALGEALHARLLPAAGVRVGHALRRLEGGWNEATLRLVYPFPYQAVIEAEARRNNLDPYLVAGLIRQESGFLATARSPAGALGLMQIMPATGTSLARELGVSGFRTARLTEPDLNVRMGTRYMATMLGRYGGRVQDALAAYNAGPTRMSRWQNFPEHPDPLLFAERIPFTETRDYVRIVQTNAAIYRALYAGR
jgi:soluble lytic murein transglycosylase